jgi:hypothetical protein
MFKHGLALVFGIAVATTLASPRAQATEEMIVEAAAWVRPAETRAELHASMAENARVVKDAFASTLEAELRINVTPPLKVASLDRNHRG